MTAVNTPRAEAAGFSRLHDLEAGDPERGQIAWLVRVARVASGRLTVSILARTLSLAFGAVLFALPAWAIGAIAVGTMTPGDSESSTGGSDAVAIAVWTVVGVVVAALLKAGLRYVEQLFGHLGAFALMGELRVWMLDRLTPRAPAVTDGAGAARVMTTAHRDIDRVEVVFAHTIAPAVTAVVVPPIAVAVGWIVAGPWVALALAVVQLLGFVVPFVGAEHGRRSARELAESRAEIAQQLSDDLRCREELLAFGAVEQRLARLDARDERLARGLRASGLRAGTRQLATTARIWIGTVLVLGVGLFGVLPDASALPGVLLAAALVPATAPALDSIERLARSLPAGIEATRRIRRLAAEPPAVVDRAVTPTASAAAANATRAETEPPAPADALDSGPDSRPAESPASAAASAPVPRPAESPSIGGALEAASFTYPERDGTGVDEVTLDARPGTVIGVCGATGSGKSTVMRLVQRRWEVDAGRALVESLPAGKTNPGDDHKPQRVDVRDRALADLWREVVAVDQSQVVLDGSLRENVTFGDPSFTDDDVDAALRAAHLDDVVASMPAGLDTPLGRRGARLSGGQRQRLAIARALLRAGDGALLMLDEATSHQDPITQGHLMGSFSGRAGATIMIAHRLDTLRDADEIIVIDDGHVAERGTWKELVAADGEFARLLAAGVQD